MPIILATLEVENRIMVQGQHRPKVHEIPSQPVKSWMWWCVPVILAMLGSISRSIMVQTSPGINARPYLKNNQSKKGWAHGSSGRASTRP
jgi:hypothetical protein